jgi:hypothetical protein
LSAADISFTGGSDIVEVYKLVRSNIFGIWKTGSRRQRQVQIWLWETSKTWYDKLQVDLYHSQNPDKRSRLVA